MAPNRKRTMFDFFTKSEKNKNRGAMTVANLKKQRLLQVLQLIVRQITLQRTNLFKIGPMKVKLRLRPISPAPAERKNLKSDLFQNCLVLFFYGPGFGPVEFGNGPTFSWLKGHWPHGFKVLAEHCDTSFYFQIFNKKKINSNNACMMNNCTALLLVVI